jgi:hypothetical protein
MSSTNFESQVDFGKDRNWWLQFWKNFMNKVVGHDHDGDGNGAQISYNSLKDKPTSIANATNATNVTTNINGHAITNIFEEDGVTVKKATNATLAEAAKGIIFPLVTSHFDGHGNFSDDLGMRIYWSNYSENAKLTVIMYKNGGDVKLYDYTSNSVIHAHRGSFPSDLVVYEQNVKIPSGHVVGIKVQGEEHSMAPDDYIVVDGAYLVSI